MEKNMTDLPTYSPNHFLNTIMAALDLRTDAELSRALNVSPSYISKARHKYSAIGPSFLIKILELTDKYNVHQLKKLLGLTKPILDDK